MMKGGGNDGMGDGKRVGKGERHWGGESRGRYGCVGRRVMGQEGRGVGNGEGNE